MVILLRGPNEMYPVVHNAGARPLAFSNPIYLDTEGGGYDHPPLADLASAKAARVPRTPLPRRDLSRRDVEEMARRIAH